MDSIVIEGGRSLTGTLQISGSKNAVLPLMVASLLTDEKLELQGTPRLIDTYVLGKVLESLGVQVCVFGEGQDESLSIHAQHVTSYTASYEFVSKMRASFWVLGALLARCGQAKVALPGGCAIGTRPVNLYLESLSAMGAEVHISDGYVYAKAKGCLKGTQIDLPFVSVGVTHVLMMVACLADGETVIRNAACEPEIMDVAYCLQKMGAQIDGIGTTRLTIQGVKRLSGTSYRIIRDRIEAGAYACAVGASTGKVLLKGIDREQLGVCVEKLEYMGVTIESDIDGLVVSRYDTPLRAMDIITCPYPGFPTDLQAPFMGLMCLAEGVSHIRETIFENRFMHVPELVRLGAHIILEGNLATVKGVKNLYGAPVVATDLRASVTLIIVALAIKGTTVINDVFHLDRGYERLEEKLSACGASIWRERVS